MVERVVTELVIDARGATAGTATYVRAMQAAQAAADRVLTAQEKVTAAAAAAGAAMTTGAGSVGSAARQWDRFVQATDPAYAVQKKMEAALVASDAAVRKLGVSQQQATAVMDAYRRTIDGSVAAEKARAAEVARVDAALRRRQQAEQQQIDLLWKEVAAQQALVQAEKQRQAAENAQASINRQLGVGRGTAGAAQQSAAAFEAAFREQERLTASARKYLDTINPTLPVLRNYRVELTELNNLQRAGLLTEDQRVAAAGRLRAAYAAQLATVKGVKQATDDHTGAIKLQAHQIGNLIQQFQDVGVSLAGGISPLMVLVQQGPQITSAVGGIGNAFRLALGLITPFTVGVAALAGGLLALTLRYASIAEQNRVFGSTLRTTGREAEVTTGQLRGLVEQMRALGTSRDDAIAAINASLRNPRVNAQQVQQIAPIAPDFAAATGRDVAQAMQEMTQAAADGYEGIKRLDEGFDFLTASQLENIRVMIEGGNKTGAVAMAMDLLRQKTEGAAREGVDPLSRMMTDFGRIYRGIVDTVLQNPTVASILKGVGDAINTVANAIERFASGSSQASLATLNAQMAETEATIAGMRRSAEMQRQANPGMAAGLDRAIERMEESRARLKAQVEAAGRDGARGGVSVGMPQVVTGGYNNPADADRATTYVNEQQAAYDRLANTVGKVGRAKEIAAARAQAEAEAARIGATEAQKEALIRIRVGEVTRQHASASGEFAVAARAAAEGAFLVADAAGKGEAAERAAAAQVAILTEQNNKATETFRQRALEEAAVLKITNETTRELERSTEASLGMAAAALQGAEAIAAETRAQYERAQMLKLGADRTDELARIMKAYDADRAAKLSEQANTEAAKIQAQADATMRVAEATKFGSAAVEEAELKNRLYAEATKLSIGSLNDQAGAIEKLREKHPELVRAIEAEIAANKKLVAEQDKLKASRDKLVAQASAYVASISDPAQRRAGELEIERLEKIIELTDRYKTVASGDGKALLDLFDETQAFREQERFWNDTRQMAEGYADDIKGYLLDGLTSVNNNGKSIWQNMWDTALAGGKRFLINFALELAKQRFIMPILTSVIGSNGSLFGVVGPQVAGGNVLGTSPGGGTDWLTSAFSLGNNGLKLATGKDLWGTVGGWFGAGAGAGSNVGTGFAVGSMADTAAAGSAAAAEIGGAAIGSSLVAAETGTMAGATLAGSAAAAEIGAAAVGSGGAAAAGGAIGTGAMAGFASFAAVIPYIGIAIAAITLLVSIFGKSKPSNLGSEFSFNLDENYTTQFAGTKHPAQDAYTKSFAEGLQNTIEKYEDEYDVRRRADATIGANFGKKEGTSFFYDAGPRDGGIEGRQVFKFDPEKDGEMEKALDGLMTAFLKDADWSGLGEDIATAVANSAATTLQELAVDIEFGEKFRDTVDFFNKGWDPVTSQMAQIKSGAEEAGRAVKTSITTFLDRTKELYPDVTRHFDEAGNELSASVQNTTQALVLDFGQANTEAEAAGVSIRDAAGQYYDFAGQIGDATLELTSASGEVTTATLNAATGVYELTSSVETFGDAVAETITEMSEQQVTAGTAVKNYALGVLGLNDAFRFVNENGVDVLKQGLFEVEPALTGLDLALETSRQNINGLVPALEAAGISAEQIAVLIPAAMARAEAEVRATFARMAQANTFAWTSAFNPEHIPTVGEVFATAGADLNSTPVFRDTINSFLLAAGAGTATQADYQGLADNFIWQSNNNLLTGQQLQTIKGMVDAAFQANLRRQQASVPANDNTPDYDSGTSTTGGGGGGDGGRSQLQDAVSARRDELRAINESISARERERDTYLDLAERTKKFRESLLLNSALTPLNPTLALAEARRQFEVTAAKAMAGDQDAIRDLEGVSTALLEKSRAYYASTSGQLDKSTRYQEDFSRVQSVLLSVEGKARDYAAEAVNQLVTLNAQAKAIEMAIEDLESQISAIGGGTGGTPGSPSNPGNPSNPSNPSTPNYNFGFSGLGRLQGESADTFVKRMFPNVATKIAGADGIVSDKEGYEWSIAPHSSGLKTAAGIPLSNAGYFSSARSAGFMGPFRTGAHVAFLNSEPGGTYWRAFIDDLRTKVIVPKNFFAGAPKDYATGGLVTGGIPGMDSVHARLMPGEFVMPTAAVRRLGLPKMEAMRSGQNDNEVVDRLGKLVDLAARIIERQDAQIRQNEAAAKHVGAKVEETTEAVKRSRPRQTDPGLFKRAG